MLVKEFLNLCYKVNKNGNLSKLAISFMVKHNLKDNQDVSEEDLIILTQHLSSKEKRIQITKVLLERLVNKSTKNSGVGSWREKTYKQVARELHPDSETGDTKSFQFLQEVKEYFWDYKGNPRNGIFHVKWSREKMLEEGWTYEHLIKAWVKNGEKPIYSEDY